jgi:hypothetical protein
MTKVASQELNWKNLPHTPYSPDLAHWIRTSSTLSPIIFVEFPSTMLSSKIDSMTSSQQNWQISSSVGMKTYRNIGRHS